MKIGRPFEMMFDLGAKLANLASGTWKTQNENRIFFVACSFTLPGQKPLRFLIVGRTAYLLLEIRPDEKKAVWCSISLEEVRGQIQTFEIELMNNSSFGELLGLLERKNTTVFV